MRSLLTTPPECFGRHRLTLHTPVVLPPLYQCFQRSFCVFVGTHATQMYAKGESATLRQSVGFMRFPRFVMVAVCQIRRPTPATVHTFFKLTPGATYDEKASQRTIPNRKPVVPWCTILRCSLVRLVIVFGTRRLFAERVDVVASSDWHLRPAHPSPCAQERRWKFPLGTHENLAGALSRQGVQVFLRYSYSDGQGHAYLLGFSVIALGKQCGP